MALVPYAGHHHHHHRRYPYRDSATTTYGGSSSSSATYGGSSSSAHRVYPWTSHPTNLTTASTSVVVADHDYDDDDHGGYGSSAASAASETAPRIDMNVLLRTRRNRNHRKNAVYCEVLRLCHRRIRFMAKRLQTWCVFSIPSFVPGLPRFNLDACTRYVCSKLRQNGFDLTFVPPQTLMVSWKRHEENVRGRAERKRARSMAGVTASRAFYNGGGRGAGGGGGGGGATARRRMRKSRAWGSAGGGGPTLSLNRPRSHLDAPAPRYSVRQRRPPPRPPAFDDDDSR